MRVYHKLLSTPGARYEDLGADYYDKQRNRARQVSHHVGKLGDLGYKVTIEPLDTQTGELISQPHTWDPPTLRAGKPPAADACPHDV